MATIKPRKEACATANVTTVAITKTGSNVKAAASASPPRASTQRWSASKSPSTEPFTASARIAIDSLDTVEVSGEIIATPKPRADTRARTEPRSRFARGTSPNGALDDVVETLPTSPVMAAVEPPTDQELETEPQPQLEPQQRSSPSLENHVVRQPWEPEHTSHTAAQLATFRPSRSMWLGTVVSQPLVGARLVIGMNAGKEFTVTSPVAKIATRQDGVLVQTTSNSRYFVANDGGTFLVRRQG